jgi:hypothetical protein
MGGYGRRASMRLHTRKVRYSFSWKEWLHYVSRTYTVISARFSWGKKQSLWILIALLKLNIKLSLRDGKLGELKDNFIVTNLDINIFSHLMLTQTFYGWSKVWYVVTSQLEWCGDPETAVVVAGWPQSDLITTVIHSVQLPTF